jgi:DNA-binding MarR family transcriptional regulator
MDKTVFKHEQPNDSAGFLLWQVTSLWQAKIANALAEFGVTQLQFAILASLKWFEEHYQETTQAHIVAHAKIDKMAVSRALRKLESLGWVRRIPSQVDGRALGIGFTEQGYTDINRAIIAVEQADDLFFSQLSELELSSYKALTVSLIKGRE